MALECEVDPSRACAAGRIVDKPAVNLAGRENSNPVIDLPQSLSLDGVWTFQAKLSYVLFPQVVNGG